MTALAPVSGALEAGLRDGIAPALSAVVRLRGRTVHASVHGTIPAGPEGTARPLRPDDRFDVASLTKAMATATLAAGLAGDGRLELDAPVAARLAAFGAAGKGGVTARQLLAHASGLPSWKPYFELARADPVAGALFLPPAARPTGAALAPAVARGRALVREAVLAERLEAPPSARAVYGDPAFLVLGWLLEDALGIDLATAFEARVARPLGLARTSFRPAAAARRDDGGGFPPTERCPHRHEVNQGDVNDDNAWAVGGVAGHAGLFSTAEDVAALGQAWLDALDGGAGFLRPEVAAEFARRDAATPRSERALGWDTPSAGGSSLGTRLGRGPRGAIGHLGYTGCSLWIDLDREVVCALLTNHCHPDGSDKARIRAFRARFHDAVAEALGIP